MHTSELKRLYRDQAYQLMKRTIRRMQMVRQRYGVTERWPPPRRLLGCTYLQMRVYLGRDVHSGLDLDHIIPLSQYDFHNPVDVRRAFNFRNTQLLAADEHRRKGSQLPSDTMLQRLRRVQPSAWD